MRSPPSSPDLNPIEWVWADLKRHVRKRRCKTVQDLMSACKEFQNKMTPQYCQNYIKNFKHVISKIGEWSNF